MVELYAVRVSAYLYFVSAYIVPNMLFRIWGL